MLDSEDSGMVELLVLNDAIDAVVKSRDVLHLSALESQPIQTATQTVPTVLTTDLNASRLH